MSRQMDALQKALAGTPILAAAEAKGTAYAITAQELLTAKSKMFGGAKIVRYPRTAISKVDFFPDAYANRLELTIGSDFVMAMYGHDEMPQFEQLIAALKSAPPRQAEK